MRTLLFAALAVLPMAVLSATPATVTLEVRNMTCGLCPITVKKSLERVPGVRTVQVDFDSKTATVSYDPDQVRPEALINATTNAGYPSAVHR